MSNSKTSMAQGSHKRLSFNRASYRSLSRSRKSVHFSDVHHSYASNRGREQISLNSNNKAQRRASSASSIRSHMSASSDGPDVAIQRPVDEQTTATNSFSCPIPQISLSTTEQFDIPDESITRECIVCATEKLHDQFEGMYGDSCLHVERTVCNTCVYENTKYLVEDFMIYYGEIVCPEPNCNGIFDYQGIREILLYIGKNDVLFEKYDQHLIYHQLEQMPEFVWCGYECGSGQLHGFEASANPIVTCVKCNRPTCFKHRVVWHADMSCDQYDILKSQPSETDANNKWLELFSKQCPQCQWHIQKYEGCDHMTCRYCKHEFCWECFVDYKLLASKGNSQHKTSCSHYEPDPSTLPAATPPDQS